MIQSLRKIQAQEISTRIEVKGGSRDFDSRASIYLLFNLGLISSHVISHCLTLLFYQHHSILLVCASYVFDSFITLVCS